MLMIRFQRIGRTNDPAFRIVLLEKSRAAKAGNITEHLGNYNPKSKTLTLDADRVKEWIAKGAQPSDSIRNLLISKGILSGEKVNVLPKKTPIKKEVKEAVAPVHVETPVFESTVSAPTEAEVIAEALPEVEEAPVAEKTVE
ncbi:MAG: 30S ribosomal protein S16 [Candidatus Paceibacterota bacterium]|jgi:small subunit ribosomal protein S16